MRLRTLLSHQAGYGLLELLLVLALVSVCLGAGAIYGVDGLRAHEARGAAQAWQSAAAWAQVGVLWHGGTTELEYDSGALRLTNDLGLCGGDVGECVPPVPVTTNLARWQTTGGARVSFGNIGAPDGGGSLYFQAIQGAYRVVVRPESGLTVRSPLQP